MTTPAKRRRITAVCRLAALTACLCLSCIQPQPAGREAGWWRAGFRETPIGIGEDYAQEARTVARVGRDLEVLRTNGLEVLRISFPWDAIEVEPGKYEWNFWDDLVRLAADEYHLRLVAYVCYTPRWASSSEEEDFWRHPPKDNALFASFMKRIAQRYGRRIRSWEIWNEPDNAEYWRGTVEQYGELLQAGSQAVREADPAAKVVMGGLAWNLDFLEAMLTNAPAITNVDVINLHNYYETWSADPLERLPDYVGRASDILLRHGKHQPIWMAEVGYSSFRRGPYVSGQVQAFYGNEHTPEHQASSLFRALSLLLASGKVSLVTWYRVNDLPGTQEVIGDVNNRHLGVLDQNGHPKPALRALNHFQSLFGEGYRCIDDEAKVEKRISAPAEAHVFARPDGSVVATAWLRTVVPGQRGAPPGGEVQDTRREQIEVLFPFPTGRNAQVYDALGRAKGTITLHRQPSGGRVARLELKNGEVVVLIAHRAGKG